MKYKFWILGKPATTGFNTNAPVFGAGAPSTSLFGNSSQPASGLFGAPSATSAFGAPSTTQSFGMIAYLNFYLSVLLFTFS